MQEQRKKTTIFLRIATLPHSKIGCKDTTFFAYMQIIVCVYEIFFVILQPNKHAQYEIVLSSNGKHYVAWRCNYDEFVY